MPRKKQGDIPPSWQARKNGDDVAVWVPREVRDRMVELHESRGERRAHWTMRDTWILVVSRANRYAPWRVRRAKVGAK